MKYLLAYVLPLSCLLALTYADQWVYLVPVIAFVIIDVQYRIEERRAL